MNIQDLNLVKEKTACVTGHRFLQGDIDLDRLKKHFINIINKGVDTFLIGMALGFDTLCFKTLEKIRYNGQNIRLIACIPCPEQDKFFNANQKEEYKRMLDSADFSVILSEKYTAYCMQKRNRFMVDNSSVIVGYLRDNRGGTFNTLKYAISKDIKIIKV